MLPSSLRPEWWPAWLTLTVDQDFFAIYPELALTALAFAVLLLAAVFPRREAGVLSALAAAGLGFTLVPIVEIYLRLPNHPEGMIVGWGGLYILDPFALFFKALFVISGFLAVLLSVRYLDIEKAQAGEYYALIMFAVVGMMFMASGRDLLMIFIGLETMSISTYVLAGFLKRDRRSNESALKYFLLGSFSTGLLLYGISLLYAVTGTTDLARIATALPLVAEQELLVVGLILVVAALGFKIAAVPFHMWVPDTYEGAPTAVAAFFSTGVKAAAFSIVVRILVSGFPEAGPKWAALLAILSAASMTLGNLGALLQENVKRMLAYSSVAHAGYVLLGVLAAQRMGETGAFGVAAVAVYLLTYTFTNMGAFGLVTALRREGLTGDQVDDFTGLSRRAPFAAFCMLVFMLSLAGIPTTAGFIGKWWLFGSAIKAGYAWLAILAVLNSAVSLYFYLRIVVRMYMGDAGEAHAPFASRPLTVALSISLIFTLWIGLYPQPFLRLAQLAILR